MISRFLKASKTLRNKLSNHPGQQARARKRKQRLWFETLEDRRLLATLPASPALLSSIEGFNIDDNAFNTDATYLQPPDPYGAVGPSPYLECGQHVHSVVHQGRNTRISHQPEELLCSACVPTTAFSTRRCSTTNTRIASSC